MKQQEKIKDFKIVSPLIEKIRERLKGNRRYKLNKALG